MTRSVGPMLPFACAATFVTSLAILRALLSRRLSKLAVDQPNERSLHKQPVPRTGGLAILIGASVGISFQPTRDLLLLWGLLLGLGMLSFLDDRAGLSVRLRLAMQFGAGIAAALAYEHLSWPFFVPGVLTTVWMVNLYNFMDGSDGLAGGMAALGFSAYAAGCVLGGDPTGALVSGCLGAGAAAFLVGNFPPARIFMGDAGSTSLGFAAAAIGLHGFSTQLWPLWFPGLVFLPFIGDATVTLARRALRGERVWQAHREHYYQRMIRSGWSHRRMAWVAYALMLGTGGSAVLTLRFIPAAGWPVLASWVLVIAALMRAVDQQWSTGMAARGERDGRAR
jgi:UDP-N-acetylmuramyl pentapeptide phosphotransferase/UDP-N-acetylglucosamine-1-phosphate transferase